ncbi:unnamed protein product [Rotaria sp. Silwood1]|nr:unnamed protein product [Rotaria sp. Silwood1]
MLKEESQRTRGNFARKIVEKKSHEKYNFHESAVDANLHGCVGRFIGHPSANVAFSFFGNDDMTNGINLLQLCQHENIIRFYGSVESATNHQIYLEYVAGGSLLNKIGCDGSLREGVAQHYFKQLITEMAYIHSLGVVHRDLKPQNILIGHSNLIKIIDFGLASLFRNETTHDEKLLTTYYGTRSYMSPQVYSRLPYRGEPADIWSSAIILIFMLVGNLPWTEASHKDRNCQLWFHGRYNNHSWKNIQNTIFDLLRQLLIYDPEQRATINKKRYDLYLDERIKEVFIEFSNSNSPSSY